MDWKFGRNRKKGDWEFQAEPLKESVQAGSNPFRGWYSIYTFQAEEEIDPEELKWSIRKDETLALVLFDIGGYREKELDETALKNLDRILTFFTEQKKEILFRPVYDREGRGRENEPESFGQVLRHLSQIGQVLRQGNYSLYVFQGLLVGSWGEMHTSAFLSKEHLQKLREVIAPCLGNDSFLAVRTPAQLRMLEEESAVRGRQEQTGKERQCQLTLFDDAVFGSATHLGTFGTMARAGSGWEGMWTRQEELGFIHQIAETAPVGGEVVASQEEAPPASSWEKETSASPWEKESPDSLWGKERTDLPGKEERYTEKILSELRQLQVTYLNNSHDLKLLDHWKNIPMQAEGISLYDFTGMHMGYRLLIKKVQLEVAGKKKIHLRVEMENTGFANLYRPVEVLIFLADTERKLWQHSFQVKAGAWKPGEARAFELTAKAEAGAVFAGIRSCGQKPLFLEPANENFGKHRKDSLLLGYLCRKEKV